MDAIASQIIGLTIVYSTVYSDADQRKHQSSASLAFVRGFHRWPVNSPHKWPVTRKMFSFDDVIMIGILGHRLANIHVGVTNVVPRDQQRMSPSQFNLKECDFYPGQVPDDATVRINCPPRITGRYLVVQLQDSNFLTLCEVTAAAGWCQGPLLNGN